MEQPKAQTTYLEPVEGGKCEFDYVRLKELVDFQLEHNPKLKGKKCRDIAIGSGISESTYKNLMSGRNRNPTIGILTGILDFVGGGSIDRLVGLAPPRDFEKEAAQYDASLMESMQARMKEKEQRVTELIDQVGVLEDQKLHYQRMYKDECIKVASLESDLRHMNERVVALQSEANADAEHRAVQDRQSGDLRDDLNKVRNTMYRQRMGLIFVSLIAFAALVALVYLLWEIANPTIGNIRFK